MRFRTALSDLHAGVSNFSVQIAYNTTSGLPDATTGLTVTLWVNLTRLASVEDEIEPNDQGQIEIDDVHIAEYQSDLTGDPVAGILNVTMSVQQPLTDALAYGILVYMLPAGTRAWQDRLGDDRIGVFTVRPSVTESPFRAPTFSSPSPAPTFRSSSSTSTLPTPTLDVNSGEAATLQDDTPDEHTPIILAVVLVIGVLALVSVVVVRRARDPTYAVPALPARNQRKGDQGDSMYAVVGPGLDEGQHTSTRASTVANPSYAAPQLYLNPTPLLGGSGLSGHGGKVECAEATATPVGENDYAELTIPVTNANAVYLNPTPSSGDDASSYEQLEHPTASQDQELHYEHDLGLPETAGQERQNNTTSAACAPTVTYDVVSSTNTGPRVGATDKTKVFTETAKPMGRKPSVYDGFSNPADDGEGYLLVDAQDLYEPAPEASSPYDNVSAVASPWADEPQLLAEPSHAVERTMIASDNQSQFC